MPHITVGEENTHPIQLHYEDHGSGQPIVLIHGWPLSNKSWEKQEGALLNAGYRVITYCRRGFGESDKPRTGYDYDTLAQDLNLLLNHLDVHAAVLVGFSMGAGEVARYMSTYGSKRIAKVAIISGILPALLKSDDNPEGVDRKVFEDMMKNVIDDRPAFLAKFLGDFYAHNALGMKQVSKEVVDFSWLIAAMASPTATLKCISAWLEDFRSDCAKIDVPALVIHGDSDRILPIKATGHRTRDILRGCKYVEITGAPHGLLVSHADEVNKALFDFLSAGAESQTGVGTPAIDLRH